MKTIWQICLAAILLAYATPLRCVAQETGEIHEVEVVGEGTDADSALQAAFTKALQTTIGVVVHSQSTVRNYELTDDILRVLTNGCIESYEELLSQSQNGVTRVAIRARVRRGIVADFLGVQRPKHRVELKDEWARLSTTARGREQAVQMLRSLILGISPKLYKVTLIDLQSGAEIGAGGTPLPQLEQGKDSIVHATWAALITPDLDFWDKEASPLIAQCLETLSERCGELYIRMESERPEPPFYEDAPDGFDGNFTTAPLRRWQRILPHGPLPWENAAPVPVVHSAPHRIALQRNSKDAGGTQLSVYCDPPGSLQPAGGRKRPARQCAALPPGQAADGKRSGGHISCRASLTHPRSDRSSLVGSSRRAVFWPPLSRGMDDRRVDAEIRLAKMGGRHTAHENRARF